MSIPNLIRIILVIAPWLSVVFLPKKSFRRFLPISLFASVLVIGMCSLAIPYKWWIIKGGWKYKLINDLSFIFGPFFVGTLWIFHFTFGNFKKYFLVNLIIDWIFSYPLNNLFQRLKLYKLVNFTPQHIYLSFLSFALTIYGYQLILNRHK